MKITKILTIAGILSSFAVSAHAATHTNTAGGDLTVGTAPAPTAVIKPSKNVLISYNGGGGAIGNGFATYAVDAIHSSGTKQYASSAGDTKIFMKDNVTGALASPAGAPAIGASIAAGYTAM